MRSHDQLAAAPKSTHCSVEVSRYHDAWGIHNVLVNHDLKYDGTVHLWLQNAAKNKRKWTTINWENKQGWSREQSNTILINRNKHINEEYFIKTEKNPTGHISVDNLSVVMCNIQYTICGEIVLVRGLAIDVGCSLCEWQRLCARKPRHREIPAKEDPAAASGYANAAPTLVVLKTRKEMSGATQDRTWVHNQPPHNDQRKDPLAACTMSTHTGMTSKLSKNTNTLIIAAVFAL